MPLDAWDQRLKRFAAGPYAGVSIALVVVLAYWPLSTFGHSISAGDTLDCWLPWRWFIAAALQDGAFPAWNPYQQMGYPVHADLQGPAWYPEALILGGTIGHGVHMLSVLFLVYLALAGEGMRRLVLYLHAVPWVAWLAGIAFALSGFFTGHAMHFYAVIAGAWMPWLFRAVLRLLDQPTPRHAFIVALFLFLLLTGGNHTFLIMAAYPLMALGLHALYAARQRGDRAQMRRLVLYSSLAIATAAVLAIGTLHALWEVAPQLERSQGLSLEDASVNPFTLRAAWSLVLPWTAAAASGELGTDPSMANGHFGLLMLLFAMIGMMRPLQARERILMVTAVVAALAALGPALPVHALLWRWLPGMDLFRFPAYFHYYVAFSLLPFAAKGLLMYIGSFQPQSRGAVVLTAGLVLAMMVFAGGWDWPVCSACSMAEHVAAFPTAAKAQLNGALALLFLGVALPMRGRPACAPLLSLLVVLELFLAVQVTQWHTTLGTAPPEAIQWRIDAQPSGPVLPELEPMGESRDGSEVMHHLWRNTQVFQGRPSHDGFNSFWLKDHQALRSAEGPLYTAMLAQPFLYLAGHAAPVGKLGTGMEVWPDAPALVEEEQVARSVKPAAPTDRVELLSFDHRSFAARVVVADTALLVVQQNHYPGWRVAIDAQPAPLHRVNGAAFGVVVPPGTHRVEIRYHKPVLRTLLLLSYGTFFLLLMGLSLTSSGQRLPRSLATLGLLLAFLWSVHGHTPKADRLSSEWGRLQQHFQGTPGVPMVVNTDRPHLLQGVGNMLPVRIDRPDHMEPLDTLFRPGRPDSLWLAWAGLPLTDAVRAWAVDRFGTPLRRVGNADAGAWLLSNGPPDEQAVLVQHQLADGPILLSDPGSPYTPAIALPAGELAAHPGRDLCIDLRFRAGPGAQLRVVLERKRNGRTVDYEAVALPASEDGDLWRHLYITRPVGILVHGADELMCYAWNASGSPASVSDIRVRLLELPR